MRRRLLIIAVAGLDKRLDLGAPYSGFTQTLFPALTCSVQAGFRTAAPPSAHGVVANGWFFRSLGRPMFWEQSSRLVKGKRIWEEFRKGGGRVAMLFWQQSMGEEADLLLSPAPIHKHHGGMVESFYSRPEPLYRTLRGKVGSEFRLRHYWGPMASWRSGEWIAGATCALMQDEELAPDLCLTYLPTLDYALQRSGPEDSRCESAYEAVQGQLSNLLRTAVLSGYDYLVFGDYRIFAVNEAVFPNRALRRSGHFRTRPVHRRTYPDFLSSRAFAVVDHEIAHVHIRDPADRPAVMEVLQGLRGVAEVLDSTELSALGLNHRRSGELLIISDQGKWFAYPWWETKAEAPEFARHVDIHNKPGFDPCELFFGWPPMGVTQDTSRVRGSHGRTGPGREVAWASSIPFPRPENLIGLAKETRRWLNQHG
jgi:predicted AlkP superfamily pyrophosphatase or phosphodiesterase